MNIISKYVRYFGNSPGTTLYKASFVTDDGVIHRVDFDENGRILNLCVYTSFTPDIHVNDLQKLLDNILEIVAH